jgi:hypothetical protein
MECKFAYLEKNIDYVLCDKEPKPNPFDRTELFHAVCAHQAHCPKQKCHKLTASWLNCVKLAEKPQDNAGEDFEGEVSVQEEAQKKRSRKATAAKSEE